MSLEIRAYVILSIFAIVSVKLPFILQAFKFVDTVDLKWSVAKPNQDFLDASNILEDTSECACVCVCVLLWTLYIFDKVHLVFQT